MCGISFCIDKNVKMVVCCIYRPPNGDLDIFFENLTIALNYVVNKYDFVLLCGDLNINLLDNSLTTKILCDLFDSFQLNKTTCEPTRIFRNIHGHMSATSIDYAVTNMSPVNYNVKIYDPLLADHLSHIITLNLMSYDKINTKNDSNILKRIINAENLNELNMRIAEINWNHLSELDIRNAFTLFLEDLLWCFNISCPVVNIKSKIKYSNNNNKGWITKETIQQGQELRSMFRKIKTNSININTHEYRCKKNEHKRNIKISKQNYYSNKINHAVNKSKETWNIVNSRLGKCKASKKQIELNINDEIICDDVLISNTFASHFAQIANNNADSYFGYNLSLPCTLSKYQVSSLYFYEVSKSELLGVINELKNKKSVGFDGLTAQVIKSISLNIIDTLLSLVNRIIVEGYFPEELKSSVVIPVYKKGLENDIENYRQISLLSVISKIIEKIICNRIGDYLEKNNILTDSQHGFRSGRSVETASINLFDYIYSEVDRGKYTVAILFDLSKAFDSVNKQVLFNKLENIGIRGNILELIKSFMDNRTLTVKVNESFSTTQAVTLGVPQGSILGPLLFSIYINDLPSHISKGLTIMYADDTTICISASSIEELSSHINTTLDEMGSWCDRNKLMLNGNKTVFIDFKMRRNIVLRDIPLSESSKFLGTYIDSTMSWVPHIDHVCNKLNKSYFAIYQLINILSEEGLLNVYYSLAYSYIAQNISLWGKSSEGSRVFILQKRLIRLIFKLKFRESCRDIFISRRILTVPCLYIYKCLIHLKSNLHKFHIIAENHEYNTRHGNLLSIPYHRTSTFKESLYYNAIILHNSLPENIKSLNLLRYKKKVKDLLLDNGYYSVNEFLHRTTGT